MVFLRDALRCVLVPIKDRRQAAGLELSINAGMIHAHMANADNARAKKIHLEIP